MTGKNREKQNKEIDGSSKRSRRNARRDKKNPDHDRVVNPKFDHERHLPQVVAKTEKQKYYFALLNDPNVQIIIAEGLFGTGKTFCSSIVAADKFRKNEISRIIIARAYVQTGKTSGFKPGGTLDKLYPYVRNALDVIASRMGHGAYTVALGNGTNGAIEVQEVESIRGRSFDEKCFLLIEEAQQTSPEEMESIVTRIGEGCKLIISGCDSQRDITGVSGLAWFKSFAKRHDLSHVAFVNFDDPEDIVRSGVVKEIAYGLAKDAGNSKFK
jgi:phosphate starvation-inducible PhoH-like protein